MPAWAGRPACLAEPGCLSEISRLPACLPLLPLHRRGPRHLPLTPLGPPAQLPAQARAWLPPNLMVLWSPLAPTCPRRPLLCSPCSTPAPTPPKRAPAPAEVATIDRESSSSTLRRRWARRVAGVAQPAGSVSREGVGEAGGGWDPAGAGGWRMQAVVVWAGGLSACLLPSLVRLRWPTQPSPSAALLPRPAYLYTMWTAVAAP